MAQTSKVIFSRSAWAMAAAAAVLFWQLPARAGLAETMTSLPTQLVMQVNGAASVAYDFSATILPGGKYISTFHAEKYTMPGPCSGDSVAARYSYDPLSFGTHYAFDDLVITRSANDTPYQKSVNCNGEFGQSGAANPILIYNQEHFWGLYYLTLRREPVTASLNRWKHYLNLAAVWYAQPGADIQNIHSSPMYVLKNATGCADDTPCVGGNTWGTAHVPGYDLYSRWTAALVGKSFGSEGHPSPTHQYNGTLGDPAIRMASSVSYNMDGSALHQNTWGLMGSMSYDGSILDSGIGADSKLYYFYNDVVYDSAAGLFKQKLLRRELLKTRTGAGTGPGSHEFFYLTAFHPAVEIKGPGNGSDYLSRAPGPSDLTSPNPTLNDMLGLVTATSYVKVNYHPRLRKWVVLYGCQFENRNANGTTVMVQRNGQTVPETKQDICLQTSGNPELSDVTLYSTYADYDNGTDVAYQHRAYGLRIYNDAPITSLYSPTNPSYFIGQFNIRKDGWGWHVDDQTASVVVYFPLNATTSPVPQGVWIFGKRVFLN